MLKTQKQIFADAHEISALCHSAEEAALTAIATAAEMHQKLALFAISARMSATDARPALARSEAALAGLQTGLAKIGEAHLRAEKDLADKVKMDVPLTCPDDWASEDPDNVVTMKAA